MEPQRYTKPTEVALETWKRNHMFKKRPLSRWVGHINGTSVGPSKPQWEGSVKDVYCLLQTINISLKFEHIFCSQSGASKSSWCLHLEWLRGLFFFAYRLCLQLHRINVCLSEYLRTSKKKFFFSPRQFTSVSFTRTNLGN